MNSFDSYLLRRAYDKVAKHGDRFAKADPLIELILGGGVIAVLYLTLLPITGAINSIDLKEVRKIIGAIKPIQQLAEPFLTVMERIAKYKQTY
jgi:hypothetical protein